MELLIFVLPLLLTVAGLVFAKKKILWLRILSTLGVLAGTVIYGFYGFFIVCLAVPDPAVAAFCFLAAMIILCVFLLFAVWHKVTKKKAVVCGALFAVPVIVSGVFFGILIYKSSLERVEEAEMYTVERRFDPYRAENELAVLDGDQTLDWDTDEPLPILDGATALYPVYAAVAKETYPAVYFTPNDETGGYMPIEKSGDGSRLSDIRAAGYTAETREDHVLLTTTPYAYDSLINGDVDMIFVASASDEQMKSAKERGVELVFTPIGREAFVFFVNRKNPVPSLTVSQLIDIYAGRVTNWHELGVTGPGKIKAFQRPKNSGSQTALEKLMGSTPLMQAPTEHIATGMGDIIREASYTNYGGAIGYSFRFYATALNPSDGIRLIAVNGVEPTKENIENQTYPLASSFYAVTRADASANTKKLLDFIVSEDGQSLIEKTGYSRAGESAWKTER